MKKLTSNTDFGLYVKKLDINDHKKLELRENYDLFLKQPLALGMFVPAKFVNGEWVVLEDPKSESFLGSEMIAYEAYRIKCEEYQEAKDRVLFEGFEIIKKETHNLYQCKLKNFDFVSFWNKGCELGWYQSIGIKTIEDLVKYHLVLTESVIKQVFR